MSLDQGVLPGGCEMRKALLVCSAVGCLTGFFFDTPNQRFYASLIVVLLSFPVCYLALWAARRNWLQFSLRDLLLAITFYAIGLTAWTYWIAPAYYHRQLETAVEQFGGRVRVTGSQVSIDATAKPITDDDLAMLTSLGSAQIVTGISLNSPLVTDVGIAYLTRFPNVTGITLRRCAITDEGVKLLQIPTLRALGLYETPRVTSDGVAGFSDCEGLTGLMLYDTSVTAEQVAELRRAIPACDIYYTDPSQPFRPGMQPSR